MKESNLLKEEFLEDGSPGLMEVVKKKIVCISDKVKEVQQNLDDLSLCNKETIVNLQ